ncbi:GNAT family N-acetyltransferase [Rhodococcus sp. NPDC003318]|uniref:GNAT family N-acetyltransferase n=1 Tax=Rhodococcus sp. NPDC003318 TaxID=3364503 RepID=UPI0036A717D4
MRRGGCPHDRIRIFWWCGRTGRRRRRGASGRAWWVRNSGSTWDVEGCSASHRECAGQSSEERAATVTHRIEHKPEQNRFEIFVDDRVAGHADYTVFGEVRDFDHTVTDPAFRGQGLAGKLVAAALDATRADGLKIATSCSYVDTFVARNPEYKDLVA